jgi:hypothetical protein
MQGWVESTGRRQPVRAFTEVDKVQTPMTTRFDPHDHKVQTLMTTGFRRQVDKLQTPMTTSCKRP